MSATINFATPISETVGGGASLDTASQSLPVTSVVVSKVQVDPNSGQIVVSGIDNNGVPHSTTYALDGTTTTALKAGLQTHLQAVYPSNGVTVT